MIINDIFSLIIKLMDLFLNNSVIVNRVTDIFIRIYMFRCYLIVNY